VAATFVIFLREGVEASLIVAILLSYLDRLGERRHYRDVFVGVGAALVLAGGGGVAAYLTVRTYAGSRVQTIFETCTFVVAAVVLTYMTFWMRGHARTISQELRQRAAAAMGRRQRAGLGLLAFQAVGREGLETAVFTLAIVFAGGPGGTVGMLAGAAAGLVAALALAFAIFRLGRRVNLGLFFRVVGALLAVFAAGLVADTVENLQQLGWLPVLGRPLWDTSGILSEGSALGDVLHSLFGYADRPSALQLGAYLAFLALTVGAFALLERRDRGRDGELRRTAASGDRTSVLDADASAPAPDAPAPAGRQSASRRSAEMNAS
jgi:high-affinity iron transporter